MSATMNEQLIRQLSDRISLKEAEQRRLADELNTLNIRRSFVDGELSGLRVALDKATSIQSHLTISVNLTDTNAASVLADSSLNWNEFAPAPETRRI